MPPKNKKQLEQQAKRLEEEQRKKQQEQKRLLQQQRKKYALQKLQPTQLDLPVTAQLVRDFFQNSSEHIKAKLRDNITEAYPSLKQNPALQSQLIKQLQYVIKNACALYGIQNGKSVESSGSECNVQKVRVICGIFMKIFMHNHHGLPVNEGERQQQCFKDAKQDEKAIKSLILNHSRDKNPNEQIKIFQQGQLTSILKFFKSNYFDHFLIAHRGKEFKPKREHENTFNIFIATPNVQYNDTETVFVDLSERSKQVKPQEGENQQGNEDLELK